MTTTGSIRRSCASRLSARALRDKSSDLLKRQKIAERGRIGTKLGPDGDANEGTQRKVLLLGELLARFEKRLALLEPAG